MSAVIAASTAPPADCDKAIPASVRPTATATLIASAAVAGSDPHASAARRCAWPPRSQAGQLQKESGDEEIYQPEHESAQHDMTERAS
jgi:hypothetical protein